MKTKFNFIGRYEPRAQENKKELQFQLNQQVKEFLENGGHIQKIPTGLCVGFGRIKRGMTKVRERENYQNTED
jgi:hypothetical protein